MSLCGDLHSNPLFFLSLLPATSNFISLCLSQHLQLKIKTYWRIINYCKELYFCTTFLFSACFSLETPDHTDTYLWLGAIIVLLIKLMQNFGAVKQKIALAFCLSYGTCSKDWENCSSRNQPRSEGGVLRGDEEMTEGGNPPQGSWKDTQAVVVSLL